ncbi:MAG: DUF2062 domain-containing protein [Planctomycetes bacterium]|nr:DUF2062 domain-containing protein [Planctomycetota bacterium]
MKNKPGKRKSRYPLVRFFRYRVLHIDDSPHRIALGLAIGLFISFSPIVGIHLPLVIILALLLKANKFTALTSVWVCNVFTIVFIFYPSYLVGWVVCGIFRQTEALRPGQVAKMFTELFSFSSILSAFYENRFWVGLWNLFKAIGLELTIGGTILGAAAAIAGYFGCVYLIKWHRKRNPHKRFEKHR